MFSAPALSSRLLASTRPLCSVPALPAVFRRAWLTLGCLAAVLAPSSARAATPGELDTSFLSVSVGTTVYSVALQQTSTTPTLLLGGDQDAFNRLNSTGADATFADPDFGNIIRIVYTIVPEVVLNSAGTYNYLIGGQFGRSTTQVTAKEPGQNIKRVSPDGTLDTTFNPGKGANNFVTAILPLADGGMVVGGLFDQFNNQNHGHIVRLDGTGAVVDNSLFNSTLTFDDTVLSLAAQVNPDPTGPQGQVLAAGTFSNVGGQSHAKLARLNRDGTVDASFAPVFSDRVRIVVSQPDGKVLAGGDFNTVNGVTAKHIVRLNYNGSVDTSFVAQVTTQPPLIAAPVAVNVITPVGDGRYYVGGNFAQIDGVARRFLGRIRADGSVDEFDPALVITNAVQQLAVDPETNGVYVAETRSKSINDVFPPTLIRLFGDPVPIPRVIITAPVAMATRAVPGEFQLVRTKSEFDKPLNVYVTLSGNATLQTAQGGGDFVFLSPLTTTADINGETTFLVTFPAEVNTVNIFLKPRKEFHGSATVRLTVQPDPGATATYVVGKKPAATVSIFRAVAP